MSSSSPGAVHVSLINVLLAWTYAKRLNALKDKMSSMERGWHQLASESSSFVLFCYSFLIIEFGALFEDSHADANQKHEWVSWGAYALNSILPAF